MKFVKLSERGRFRDHFLVLDFGSRKSEVGSRKSEVGSRKSEVGSRKCSISSSSTFRARLWSIWDGVSTSTRRTARRFCTRSSRGMYMRLQSATCACNRHHLRRPRRLWPPIGCSDIETQVRPVTTRSSWSHGLTSLSKGCSRCSKDRVRRGPDVEVGSSTQC